MTPLLDIATAIDSRDCATPGCPNEAEHGDLCRYCHQRQQATTRPSDRRAAAHPPSETTRPPATEKEQPAPMPWTKDEIIAAIQAHAAQHGRPPTSNDWANAAEGRPSADLVKRRFGSWADAVEAAGFPRPQRGISYAPKKTPAAPKPHRAPRQYAADPAATRTPPEPTEAPTGTLTALAQAADQARAEAAAAQQRLDQALQALRDALEAA